MKKKIRDSDKFAWDPPSNGASPWKSAPSWPELAISGFTRRLATVIALAASCLCLYTLLIVVSGHPCWRSVHCSDSSCNKDSRTWSGALRASAQGPIDAGKLAPLQPSAAFKLPAEGGAFANTRSTATDLSHIVFGIAASSRLWSKRKDYIKLWWRPQQMRGFVWLDQPVKVGEGDKSLPPLRISQNTTDFKYTNKLGSRSAIRISRIVSETFRLGLPDVHWFVMGDDDTMFVPENLVRVLSKYDHRQYYYIGSVSESHLQNLMFSYNMAYGGGGFAISYPLAKALEKMHDQCLKRYPELFGSDDRIQACMAELGVPVTRERGFHQCDIYGNLFGLLAAHPVTPTVSLHHLDVLDPIFPNRTRLKALQHLGKAITADSAAFLQQSVCYDTQRQWSVSLSWGFAVQIYRGIFSARELEQPSRTFYNWHKRADYTAYAFNTRAVSRHPCQIPFVFYMSDVGSRNRSGWIVSNYSKEEKKAPECKWKMASPEIIESVRVVKQRDDNMWNKGPRRKCCRVAPSTKSSSKMEIIVRDCDVGEIAAA